MQKHEVLAKFFEAADKIRNVKHPAQIAQTGKPDLRERYKLPPSGLNMLRVLLENGSINQRAIAKIMNISSQAVSETIKKLEFQELIIKENGTHNNEKIITLTQSGVDFAKSLDIGIKSHASIVFENFTQEDCEEFFKYLEKI